MLIVDGRPAWAQTVAPFDTSSAHLYRCCNADSQLLLASGGTARCDGCLPASLSGVRRSIDIWDCKGGNAPGRQTKPFAMGGRQVGGDPKVMDDTSVITLR